MRRSRHVLWRATDTALVLARTDGSSCTVTGPGVELWDLLELERSREELAAELGAIYDLDPSVVEHGISPVIDQLVEDGFIDA